MQKSLCSVVGFAKFSRLGLHADTSAAFAIARKGLLSKKDDMKRRKAAGAQIMVATRMETIEGKNDPAGRLVRRIADERTRLDAAKELQKAAADKLKADRAAIDATHNESNKDDQQDHQAGNSPAQTGGKSPRTKKQGQRSMDQAFNPVERSISKALGNHREEWAARLSRAPGQPRLRPKPRAQSGSGAKTPVPSRRKADKRAKRGASRPGNPSEIPAWKSMEPPSRISIDC
jgi:hypothetical protein